MAGLRRAQAAAFYPSPRRSADQVLRRALEPLIGAIAVEPMRQANYMLDRDTDKASLQDAVEFLAKALPER